MRRARSAWLLTTALLAFSFLSFQTKAEATTNSDAILLVVDGAVAGKALARSVADDYALTVDAQWPLSALDVYCFEVNASPAAASVALIQQLKRDPRVNAVQRSHLHKVAGKPFKDPYFDLQARTRSGGIASVLRRASGRHVRIAVIDTGVDLAHPDLEGQIAVSINFVGGAADAVPAEFHGTAVVGLISARPSNGIGIHGLAPEAEMLALRACWEPAYGYGLCATNTLAQALDYAIEARAHIINLSLSGPEDPLLTRLVNRAIELGAVIFGAVGEEPTQSFPASIAAVVAVEQGFISATPVAGARLTVPGHQLLSTVPDGHYDFVTGSSFATAHASGLAAVMLELQPHLRAEDLVSWLRDLHGNEIIP